MQWLWVHNLIIYERGWEQRGGKSEHVTVIKCVLLPAVWQAPKYNSDRIADRRPDGIGSRYLSEINKLWEKTTEMFQWGGGEKKFRSLQRDFTVADIRDFTRDRSRTSKCFHIWHRYELMTVRGKGEAGGGGVGPLLEGAPKDPVSEVVPGSRDPPVVPQLIRLNHSKVTVWL